MNWSVLYSPETQQMRIKPSASKQNIQQLEHGPMPNVMAVLQNIQRIHEKTAF